MKRKIKLMISGTPIYNLTRREEEKVTNNKIAAIEYDIKETQYIIDEIEKRITENNLRFEKLKVQKKNEKNEEKNEK